MCAMVHNVESRGLLYGVASFLPPLCARLACQAPLLRHSASLKLGLSSSSGHQGPQDVCESRGYKSWGAAAQCKVGAEPEESGLEP